MMNTRSVRPYFVAVLLLGCGWLAVPPGFAQSITLQSDETRVAEETTIPGAATEGTRGSCNFAAGISDLRVPGTRRLYVEPLIILGKHQDQHLYFGQDNPGFEDERAGSIRSVWWSLSSS